MTPSTAAQSLSTAVVSIVLRAAGVLPIRIIPHAQGTPERQVVAIIGDLMLTVTDIELARRLQRQWAATYPLSKKAPNVMPALACRFWLPADPQRRPVAVSLKLFNTTTMSAQWAPAEQQTATPPHLRVTLDRVVWQVCDRTAWSQINRVFWDIRNFLEDHPR
ncbi:hypothetical protein F0L68_35455 [Solihabitans fulvus]|uniref:Uncharacterized protein n=1 Tax=Solihabitans fulvus TaxID=1892852 RepID=A0A5B2WJU4_9PSEU|nr:hypothetical protein [Solihabitans fulvus]KAA2252353.1 hypothetical protein F0L68_35455 [Solihabitans fulvus]